MKKQILAILLSSGITSSVMADTNNCTNGYDNFEHLSGCLGGVVDSGIGILADLPTDAKEWTNKQHKKAKQKLEGIKQGICDNSDTQTKEVIVEVPVEKIVYVDRVVEVPAKVQERRCVTQRQTDRFGNIKEAITCTEWK